MALSSNPLPFKRHDAAELSRHELQCHVQDAFIALNNYNSAVCSDLCRVVRAHFLSDAPRSRCHTEPAPDLVSVPPLHPAPESYQGGSSFLRPAPEALPTLRPLPAFPRISADSPPHQAAVLGDSIGYCTSLGVDGALSEPRPQSVPNQFEASNASAAPRVRAYTPQQDELIHTNFPSLNSCSSVVDPTGVGARVIGRWGKLFADYTSLWDNVDYTSVIHPDWHLGIAGKLCSIISNVHLSMEVQWSASSLGTTESCEDDVSWWILDPHLAKRMAWDIVGAVLCVSDVIMLPVNMAFDLPVGVRSVLSVMDLIVAVFWTVDLLIGFATGYVIDEGNIELRGGRVIRHYLRTWFPFDLCVVAVDWVSFIMDAGGSARLTKLIARARSVFRVLRLAKLRHKAAEMFGQIQSELLFTMFGLVKVLVAVIMLCHYVACMWYGLPKLTLMHPSWVDEFLTPDSTFFYSYSVSLHFSLAHFSPSGATGIVPQNVVERFFACGVFLVALLGFSTFLSSINQTMAKIYNLHQRRSTQDMLLRRYCSENNIPRGFVLRIRAIMRANRLTYNDKRLSESDIDVLQMLPPDMGLTLRVHVYLPRLVVHPFFEKYASLQPAALRDLVKAGISEKFISPAEPVFEDGQPITNMCFVLSGKLLYLPNVRHSMSSILVLPGQWACEETIWAIKSTLCGRLIAWGAPCQIMFVHSEMVRRIARNYPSCQHCLSQYAEAFTHSFNVATDDLGCRDLLFNDAAFIESMVLNAFGQKRLTLTKAKLAKHQLSKYLSQGSSISISGLNRVVPTGTIN